MTRVTIRGDSVRRAAGPWTPTVHAYLRHLRSAGIEEVPEPLGLRDGVEEVEFLHGQVGNYPLSRQMWSGQALESAARLLRRIHDAGADFPIPSDADWMLEPWPEADTICHGDFAPYNCVFRGDTAVGVIDFDACHPAPRTWDIAYALYRFGPVATGFASDPEAPRSEQRQAARVRGFVDAYGLEPSAREALPRLMIERIEALMTFMRNRAEGGDETMLRNIRDGHLDLYERDLDYIGDRIDRLAHALIRDP